MGSEKDLKWYKVNVPIVGRATIEVQAKDEDDAIKKVARGEGDSATINEWEIEEHDDWYVGGN